MKYAPIGVFDEMLTAVPNSSEPSINYIKCLIDGPFRQFKDQINVNQRDKDYYVHVTDLGIFPASILYNFCIATRAPIEFGESVSRWQKLVDMGVDPNLALLISARNLISKSGLYTNNPTWDCVMSNLLTPSTGHWWFNHNSAWDTVIVGKLPIMHPRYSYKQAPKSCAPTNYIWGDLDRELGRKLTTMTIKEMQEHFTK